MNKEEKILVLARGLGIIGQADDINFGNKKEVKRIVDNINAKIGPFLLNMILINKLELNEDGKWRLETINEGQREFKAMFPEGSGLKKLSMTQAISKFICSKYIYLDNSKISVPIRNDFLSLRKDLEYYIENNFKFKDNDKTTNHLTIMNSYHISNFEEAMGRDLVFKELERIVMKDNEIPIQEKLNCLLAFKLQFLEFVVSGVENPTRNNKIYLLNKFREMVFDIQAGTIRDSIKLPIPFEYTYGEVTVTKEASLSAKQLNSFFSENSLPNRHRGKELLYKTVIGDKEGKLNFRDLLALKSFSSFKNQFYNEMKEIQESLNNPEFTGNTEDKPYRHINDRGYEDSKMFFQVWSRNNDPPSKL